MDSIKKILNWKYTSYILVGLIILVVIANIILAFKLYGDYKLTGIYEFEEMRMEDDSSVVVNAYILFEKGKFRVYNKDLKTKNIEEVDSGEVKKIYSNVYTLKSGELDTYIHHMNNSFYLQNNKEDYIVKFKKSKLKSKDLLKFE